MTNAYIYLPKAVLELGTIQSAARCLNHSVLKVHKHGVYQPGKPGNLREFFKPGILREISGNFKNSLEK